MKLSTLLFPDSVDNLSSIILLFKLYFSAYLTNCSFKVVSVFLLSANRRKVTCYLIKPTVLSMKRAVHEPGNILLSLNLIIQQHVPTKRHRTDYQSLCVDVFQHVLQAKR